jgi:NAD(P)-dependent dehydrogenase (short-subunit alcohol dehydrogenase family)
MARNRNSAAPAPVVAITGASAGVGRAVAVAFARRGWRVALVLVADVADTPAVEHAADRIVGAWGRVDVWINNAMATVFAPIGQIAPEEIRRVTEVAYLGQVHGTLAALRYMRPRDRGTIVQVGSALSYRAIPLQSAYCAAKFAVRGFTDSLRCELAHAGSRIRVTMVQLPAVDTPQFDWARSRLPRRLQPVPPVHAPSPVAEIILRAAFEAPRELWVGLPTLKAILGTMVAPSLLDRLAARRAWDGQMTAEPAARGEGNLFDVPPGDPGARGRFGARARDDVPAISETMARAALAGTAILAVGGGAGLAWRLGAGRARSERDRLSVAKRMTGTAS